MCTLFLWPGPFNLMPPRFQCKVGGGACCTGSTCTTPPAGAKSQCCPTGNTNCPTGGCCRPGTTCCGDGCVASNEGCCLVITNNLTVSTGSCPKPVGECCASGPSAGLCYNSTTDYCCENAKNICPSSYICCGEKECCDPEFETCQSGTCVTTSSTPGPSPTSAAAATALSFGLAGWVLLNIFIVKVDLRLLYTYGHSFVLWSCLLTFLQGIAIARLEPG
jgi:hypothetical protein